MTGAANIATTESNASVRPWADVEALRSGAAANSLGRGPALAGSELRPSANCSTMAGLENRRPIVNADIHDAEMQLERTARAVLVVDLVESVRLMEEDEEDAIRRWRRLVDNIEGQVLPPAGGRLVKSLGDGMMLEFAHAQPAVQAAFAIQHACERLNQGAPPERRMLLRMGIHTGQLIADEHDVYGRSVNLAARLMTLAGPGEIVVSAEVRDQITPVLDADVEDLGDCYLKHVQHPVRAYRVGPPGAHPVIAPGSAVATELRPTIAVVPFMARTTEPDHQVLGEVLADEIISALSGTPELNVISRLSTTLFRHRNSAPEEVAAHLGANYMLSGAYRVSGNQLILVAELVECKSGRVLWGHSLKGTVSGVIGGEDELIDQVVSQVGTAVMARELERALSQPLPTMESYTLLMGAIAMMHRLSRRDFDRAHALLDALTERARRHAIPWAWLAKWHVLRVQQGWSDDPRAEARLALDATKRALDNDAYCSLALARRARALRPRARGEPQRLARVAAEGHAACVHERRGAGDRSNRAGPAALPARPAALLLRLARGHRRPRRGSIRARDRARAPVAAREPDAHLDAAGARDLAGADRRRERRERDGAGVDAPRAVAHGEPLPRALAGERIRNGPGVVGGVAAGGTAGLNGTGRERR